MARQIKLDYNDKEYTLEYTRASIKEMEAKGFNAVQVGDKPMTMIPLLVQGAFIKHHKYLKADLIDEMYDSIDGKQELITELSEMLGSTYTDLLEDNNEAKAKKASWKVIK